MARQNVLKWGLLLALVAVPVVVGVLALLSLRPASKPALPGPGSEVYETAVSTFSTGVAALDSDASNIARDMLKRATEAVPEEPAAWASLAVAQIRQGDYDLALESLTRATALAPNNSQIAELFGLLEQRRGRFSEALAHLKRAVDLDSKNLRARYALVHEWERQGDGNAEALRALDGILDLVPENLAALVDKARLAVKVGNPEALADVVRRLEAPSATWPPPVRERYEALSQAAGGGNPRLTTARVIALRNLLITVPEFRRNLATLELPAGTIGQPIRQFLALQPPSAVAAPPDQALTFRAEPLGSGPPRSVQGVFLLPNPKDRTGRVLEADGKALRYAQEGTEIAPFPGGAAAVPCSADGVAVADWNNDSLPDLLLAGAGGLRVLRQREDGTFEDVTEAAKLPAESRDADYFGVWVADIEMDGDLDLILGRRAGPTVTLRNRSDGTFSPIPVFESVSNLRAFAWADLDHDGDPDAAFLDEQGKLTVLDNQRTGQFQARSLPNDMSSKRALGVADLDGDAAMDLLLVGPDSILRLSDREEGKAWEQAEVVRWSSDATKQAQAAASPGEFRLLCTDLDNNGSVDLVASGPGESRLWLSEGDKAAFVPVASPPVRTQTAFDLNGDGWLDLLGLSPEGQVVRGLGAGTKPYHWLLISLHAAKVTGDGRINSFGVGGELQLRSGLLVQSQVVSGPLAHFGLGTHTRADVVRIVWPNGTVQAEFEPEANTELVAQQRLKGSCPFIYAHNGKEVRFVTDFLWRSPLGFRVNAHDVAKVTQTEDWIKIRGDQLAPLGPPENAYDIRLTAELWETHYWDHVSLMVVDHPVGTEIYVDERHSPTQPSTMKVYVTGPPRPVVSAHDDHGQDVTALIQNRDGKYLDTFELGFYQGVARDHWVEIDVGEEDPSDGQLVLLGSGWLHPTESSINVAIGQGNHEQAKDLVLEVPTAEGEWVVAREGLGYPSDKDKTIVLKLDGVFRPGAPRKLRLRTNLEIYWDAFAVATLQEAPNQLKTTRLLPAVADLRLRGFSTTTQANLSSPEVPDYNQPAGFTQRWNDLTGFYTRFGDVRELVEQVDNRYVIANAGDEIQFRFPAQEPPPTGWTRDFVLIGDGWSKDGDYNTQFAQTVLPLPAHGQAEYDTPPTTLEDDPVYRAHADDWVRFHTRYVYSGVYRTGLQPPAIPHP